ncbi:putative Serine/threonine protein kinase [Heracleum sosnowskyi]|uniref:Serine/threonine protein kinase n=1 Tax=Heracleum sosnowskyi TaxID=360622 RepID=A0AAD8GRF5_9APIA|nr:putative Serine/threonine protein kinase [Heracleum sosnowskyi]
MPLNRVKNISEAMTNQGQGHSGQRVQQESTSTTTFRDGINAGRRVVNNNVSIQTGEDFSTEFIFDRTSTKGVPGLTNMVRNHGRVVGGNNNQNIPVAYQGLTKILGLQRMDSECSDMSDFLSAKGSISEFDLGSFSNKDFQILRADSAIFYEPKEVTADMSCNQGASDPIASVKTQSDKSKSLQSSGSVVSDGHQSGKIKLLCSFGGKILHRPSDGKLRYVGGDTRIISVRKEIPWEELVKKTFGICKQTHTIKYQLPGEDLDSLVSVSCDEDLQNMIDEYFGLAKLGGSQRLRIFLIPLNESERTPLVVPDTSEQSNHDYQYVVAVNGIAEPSFGKNYSEQLHSEGSVSKPQMDRSSSFCRDSPSSLPPLSKPGFSGSHLTPVLNDSYEFIGSLNQSTPYSPNKSRQGDKNGQMQKCVEILAHGDTEKTKACVTGRLLPEKPRTDFCFPQLAADLMSCDHPSEQFEVHSQIHSPRRVLATPPRLNYSDTNLYSHCYDNSVLNEMELSSEKNIPQPGDHIRSLLASNGSTGSHPVLLHAFSDSFLPENGGRSAFYLEEGTSASSSLKVATPLLPSEGLYAALPEKPVRLQDNGNVITSEGQIKLLSTDSNASYTRMNISNVVISSGSVDRVNNPYGGVDRPDMKQNLNKEFSLDSDRRSGFDGRDHVLLQSGSVSDSWNLFAAREPDQISSNVTCNPVSNIGVQASTQDLQVLKDIISSDPNSFKAAVVEQSYQPEKYQAELVFKGQKNLAGQLHNTIGITGSEQKNNRSWAKDSEIAGMIQDTIQQYQEENVPSDPFFELSSGHLLHDTDMPPHVRCQNNVVQELMIKSSTKMDHLAVCGDAKTNPSLNNYTLMHNIAGGTATKVSLLENDLFHPPDDKIDDIFLGESYDEKKKDLFHPPDDKIDNLFLGESYNEKQKDLFHPLDDKIDNLFLGESYDEKQKDLFHPPDDKIDNLFLGESYDENQKVHAFSQSKHAEQNRLETEELFGCTVASILPGVESSSTAILQMIETTNCDVESPGAVEVNVAVDELEFEDARADDREKDECFSDAMIAEIEADIYGLQIIKNADLEELRELGCGTYGTVYHGKWRGSDVAIKRIKKGCFVGRSSEQERLAKDFWREAQILSNLHHPNVVAFYGVVPDGAGGTLATVTEFMANGSLRNVLLKKDRSLDRRKKLIIAMDAAFGMEYLHSKNIVHFDLKCDNLLVNLRDPQRPICKVGDFGLSRIKRNTLVSGGVRGTLPWMAPELLNGCSNRVTEKVDVFSFGIAMWEILTGEEPYANMHCGAIIGGIVKNTLRPPIPIRCDSEWKNLMERCWSADPDTRPSFTEITKALRFMSATLQGKGPSLAR